MFMGCFLFFYKGANGLGGREGKRGDRMGHISLQGIDGVEGMVGGPGVCLEAVSRVQVGLDMVEMDTGDGFENKSRDKTKGA